MVVPKSPCSAATPARAQRPSFSAELPETPTPLVVFLARDHHYKNTEYFSSVKENDEINVKIIGQRFELNDVAISVIGEIIHPEKNKKPKRKPKIIID